MRRRQDDLGQVTIFVVGMALVALAVVAFTIEGTRAFLMRRTLQNMADAAASAGASQLDAEAYYASGGETASIEPARAERVAAESLAMRGLEIRAEVQASPDEVEVVLRTDLPTPFLRLIGIGRVTVGVRSLAQPLVRGP